jgi:hypothetical protein
MSKKYKIGKVVPVFAALFLCALIVAFKPLQVKRDNTLTLEEKKAGWVLLFDGKTTNGWRTYGKKPQDSWEVLFGQLHCKSKATKRADLMTVTQYDNFELQFDWKVEKGANSGVVWRVIETSGASYETGPEYQLIDDEGYPEKLEEWQKSGADYGMHPPMVLASKPAGEYNHTKLIVNGAHVQHWLNSRKVADFELWSDDWKELKSKSKWKDLANYGMAQKGFIALQDHGGGIYFKNIKLRKL